MTIVLVWGQHLAARRHLIADFTFAHEELIARRVCEVFLADAFSFLMSLVRPIFVENQSSLRNFYWYVWLMADIDLKVLLFAQDMATFGIESMPTSQNC